MHFHLHLLLVSHRNSLASVLLLSLEEPSDVSERVLDSNAGRHGGSEVDQRFFDLLYLLLVLFYLTSFLETFFTILLQESIYEENLFEIECFMIFN